MHRTKEKKRKNSSQKRENFRQFKVRYHNAIIKSNKKLKLHSTGAYKQLLGIASHKSIVLIIVVARPVPLDSADYHQLWKRHKKSKAIICNSPFTTFCAQLPPRRCGFACTFFTVDRGEQSEGKLIRKSVSGNYYCSKTNFFCETRNRSVSREILALFAVAQTTKARK